MPAVRIARRSSSSLRRKALAEAPISRHQQQPALNTLDTASNQSLKSSFSVTKHARSPTTKSKHLLSFVAAKTALHRSTAAPQIIGREKEQDAIRSFLKSTVEQGHGGSMYISGNPGTGKTACLQALIKQSSSDFPSILVNCVPLTRPEQAYAAILDALDTKNTSSEKNAYAALEKLALQKRSKNAFLVILDEVDSLLGSKQEVLYHLFELAAHPDSRLALVGIANALDLTDRFLPRLQARNCEPRLLNFNPYQVKDIVEILQSRLDAAVTKDKKSTLGAATEPVIQKAALELCARKVAATSGDLRKALDVCRQAMEIAEAENRKKASVTSTNKENGPPLSSTNNVPESPKVSIMHIAKVLKNLNGSPIVQKLNGLNFQQKLVLCAYISFANTAATTTSSASRNSSGIVISSLYSEYTNICGRLNMLAPITRSEFLDLIAMMETQGVAIIATRKAGGGRGRRASMMSTSGAADDRIMRLSVDETDLRRVLTSTPALTPLL